MTDETCTEIHPHLYIGSRFAAQKQSIIDHDFKAILNVAFNNRSPREWEFPPKSCSYFQIGLSDDKRNPWWMVVHATQLLNSIILQHYDENVLVYCLGGNSRSAQIAALYLQFRKTKTITPTISHKIWRSIRKRRQSVVEYPTMIGLDFGVKEPEVMDVRPLLSKRKGVS